MTPATPLLVTGATGRMGTMLRHNWPKRLDGNLRPVWQARHPTTDHISWDILADPCPNGLAGGVVLGLAGVISGDSELNAELALATCRAAANQGARHVFLASSAAVYGALDTDLAEDTLCAPLGDYGRGKLAMEQAAREFATSAGLGLTLLRIGNVVGMDALLGTNTDEVVLDPVAGADGGPVRSYIGPASLAFVLARLADLAARRAALPGILNVAAPKPVAMADLLNAANRNWRFGPARAGVIARVVLDTKALQGLVPMPPNASDPAEMVAEWQRGHT